MRTITLQEIQQIEFEILEGFQQLCKDHQLRFFLAGGTLLGAVRHQGFIPWDDDIDILMPRSDYEKLKELAASQEIKKYDRDYSIRKPGDSGYAFPYIKVVHDQTIVYEKMYSKKFAIGVWIDIFPLDGYYNKDKAIKSYLKRLTLLRYLRYSVSASLMRYWNEIRGDFSRKSKLNSALKLCCIVILRILMAPIGCKRICIWMDHMARKMNSYEESPNYVGNGTWPSKFKDHFEIRHFDQSVDLQFETAMMPAPKGHHEYLTRMYGDYMVLPDPSERGGHPFSAYWKENNR